MFLIEFYVYLLWKLILVCLNLLNLQHHQQFKKECYLQDPIQDLVEQQMYKINRTVLI